MNALTHPEKITILTDLIALAKSDGMVNLSELTYLLWVAQKLGISKQELETLTNRQHSDFDFVAPGQRLEQLHRMLSMMFVDSHLANEEMEKCRDLAYKMGLDPAMVDELLHDISQAPDKIIDLDAIKAKFGVK